MPDVSSKCGIGRSVGARATFCEVRAISKLVAQVVCLCVLILTGCSVGQRHTRDATLEWNFLKHEGEFEELRADAQADGALEMIWRAELRYAGRNLAVPKDLGEAERLGFSMDRYRRCERLLRELGVIQVFTSKDAVVFKVDEDTVWNGDSDKGYEYLLSAPEHLRAELDNYRISPTDRSEYGGYNVSKHLKGKWYLYLSVSGNSVSAASTSSAPASK